MNQTRFMNYWLIALLTVLGMGALVAWNGLPGFNSASAGTSKPTAGRPDSDKPGWELIFADEFSGSQLNPNHWTPHYPWGRTNAGNHELEYYVDEAVTVHDGLLELRANRNNQQDKRDPERAKFPYTSGMVTSNKKQTFTYGYFEIRAKVPPGKGLWPAFWLHKANPQGWLPEIDVMEFLGHEPNRVYMTHHFEVNGQHQERSGHWDGPDFTKDFHVYAAAWTPQRITYYVDGKEVFHSTEAIPQEPVYLIANLAVGGDWPGSPTPQTRFPGSFLIDYIRVYKKMGTAK